MWVGVVQNAVDMETLNQGAMQPCHDITQGHHIAPVTQHWRTTMLAHVIERLLIMRHKQITLTCTPVVYLNAELLT